MTDIFIKTHILISDESLMNMRVICKLFTPLNPLEKNKLRSLKTK